MPKRRYLDLAKKWMLERTTNPSDDTSQNQEFISLDVTPHVFESSSPKRPFQYSKLLKAGDIRLLRLHPLSSTIDEGIEIQCDIFHINLNKPTSYTALSYTWGDPSGLRHPILISGAIFYVRENLFGALKQLQVSGDELVIWIDAVCINQDDIPERNLQVEMMRRIYERADKVIVWLGSEADDSCLAFQLIHDVYKARYNQGWGERFQHPNTIGEVAGLSRLFARPYWKRIWIVQELTVAKDIDFYCGSDHVKAEALLQVQRMIAENKELLFANMSITRVHQNMVAQRGFLEIQKWLQAWHTTKLSLFECAQFHYFRLATDPKDMLFGLAGLTRGGGGAHINIDYSRTKSEIYTEFAKEEIRTTNRLDIITRVQHEDLDDFEIPSWVPDWTKNTDTLRRINSKDYYFNATGTSKAQVSFLDSGNSMLFKGIYLDHTQDIGVRPRMTNGLDYRKAIPTLNSWWRMMEDKGGDVEHNRVTFVQTVFWAPWRHGLLEKKSPITLYEGILAGYAEVSRRHLPDSGVYPAITECWTSMHTKYLQAGNEHHDLWAKDWLDVVSDAITQIPDFRFFISASGIMGLAPLLAREGDTICLPLGCYHPMVLRRNNEHYVVVGEAFVDGYMDGEGIGMLKKGKLQLQEFHVH